MNKSTKNACLGLLLLGVLVCWVSAVNYIWGYNTGGYNTGGYNTGGYNTGTIGKYNGTKYNGTLEIGGEEYFGAETLTLRSDPAAINQGKTLEVKNSSYHINMDKFINGAVESIHKLFLNALSLKNDNTEWMVVDEDKDATTQHLYFTHSLIVGDENKSQGDNNLIAGGSANHVSGNYAGIGGGTDNWSYGDNSIVGGGRSNHVDGMYGVIVGGSGNNTKVNGFVVGGSNNVSENGGVILGGGENLAMDGSIALGQQAKANRMSFAWNSTSNKLSARIDAKNGILIGTGIPILGVNLVVNGAIKVGGNKGDAAQKGDIRYIDSCFYLFDGAYWHSYGDSCSRHSEDLAKTCRYGTVDLQEGDSVIGYKETLAEQCEYAQVICKGGVLVTKSGKLGYVNPYCYSPDGRFVEDEGGDDRGGDDDNGGDDRGGDDDNGGDDKGGDDDNGGDDRGGDDDNGGDDKGGDDKTGKSCNGITIDGYSLQTTVDGKNYSAIKYTDTDKCAKTFQCENGTWKGILNESCTTVCPTGKQNEATCNIGGTPINKDGQTWKNKFSYQCDVDGHIFQCKVNCTDNQIWNGERCVSKSSDICGMTHNNCNTYISDPGSENENGYYRNCIDGYGRVQASCKECKAGSHSNGDKCEKNTCKGTLPEHTQTNTTTPPNNTTNWYYDNTLSLSSACSFKCEGGYSYNSSTNICDRIEEEKCSVTFEDEGTKTYDVGTSITSYSTKSNCSCSSYIQTSKCTDGGTWDKTPYQYKSCSKPSGCGGGTIDNGNTTPGNTTPGNTTPGNSSTSTGGTVRCSTWPTQISCPDGRCVYDIPFGTGTKSLDLSSGKGVGCYGCRIEVTCVDNGNSQLSGGYILGARAITKWPF